MKVLMEGIVYEIQVMFWIFNIFPEILFLKLKRTEHIFIYKAFYLKNKQKNVCCLLNLDLQKLKKTHTSIRRLFYFIVKDIQIVINISTHTNIHFNIIYVNVNKHKKKVIQLG